MSEQVKTLTYKVQQPKAEWLVCDPVKDGIEFIRADGRYHIRAEPGEYVLERIRKDQPFMVLAKDASELALMHHADTLDVPLRQAETLEELSDAIRDDINHTTGESSLGLRDPFGTMKVLEQIITELKED